MRTKRFSQKEGGQRESPTLISRLLLRVNGFLLSFAGWLGKTTAAYSVRKKKAILGLFCVAFAGESAFVICSAFQKGATHVYAVTPIHVMPILAEERRGIVPLPELRRIHRYTVYLDSLGRSGEGQRVRDSILVQHPRLVDTLQYLEELYHEEIKMK